MPPPNQSWTQYRTVVLDSRAQEFIDRDEQKAPRSDDQWRGVEWVLARIPESGIPRLSSHPTRYLIYVFPRNELARTKELEVLYSYGENEVRVHSVRFVTTKGDADEG